MTGITGQIIAVVDDDDAVRDSLRFFLETVDHPVVAFASGPEFLAYYGSGLACLILDHHMPEMTGLQVAEQLRGGGSRLPIFAGDRFAIAVHRSSCCRTRDREGPRKTSQRR